MSGNDSLTKLLLHCDGQNTSTNFVDDPFSRPAKIVTASGNAQISTAQHKFGSGSALFDGSSGNLSLANSADFNPTGDFTIDCWVYPTADSSSAYIYEKLGTGSTFDAYLLAIESQLWVFSVGNAVESDVYANSSAGVTLNVWTHLALVRFGNTYTAYVNGISQGSGTSSTAPSSAATALTIGGTPSVILNGYIDEFRFSNGIARWTANFTPPSSAYSVDPGQPSYGVGSVDLTIVRPPPRVVTY
jgi:hypothetical protein